MGAVTSDPSALTISLDWTFNNQPYTNVSYKAELLNAQQSRPALLTGTTTQKSYTFSNPQGQSIIQPNTYYYVRVQSIADNVDSPWSQSSGIGVATLSPATNIRMSANNEGAISVAWDSSEGGATYKVAISIDGTQKATHDSVTTTSTGFTRDETGVSVGHTYMVKVRIWTRKNGQTSVPATQEQSLKIEGKPPRPDPPRGGDPVNLVTGSYDYSNLDIGIACAEPLMFISYYGADYPTPDENSLYTNKPLGNRWNHHYNTRIAAFDDGNAKIAVLWGDRHSDTYVVPASVTGDYLVESAPRGDSLMLTSANEYVLTTKHQQVYHFTGEGRLKSITSPAGNTLTMIYTSNQLTRIKLDNTHYLDLAYNGSGFLKTVTDPLGRRITYTYNGNNLKSMTNVMGAKRQFTYDGNSRILTITDANGNTFVKNEYDGDGRVVKQWDARAVASGDNYCNHFCLQHGYGRRSG